MVVVAELWGCGSGSASPEGFTAAVNAALEENPPAGLYDLLDDASRARIRTQLQELRGRGPGPQKDVLEQLGLTGVTSFDNVSPREYFAAMWLRAVGDTKLTAKADLDADRGEGSVTLTTPGGKSHAFQVVRAGGQWRWMLPGG